MAFGDDIAKIARRKLGLKIAPALMRAARHMFRLDKFGGKHQAAFLAFMIIKPLKANDLLTGRDMAVDDPVDGAAIQQFHLTGRALFGDMTKGSGNQTP